MLGLRSNPISAVITLICSLLSLVTACLYRMWFVGSTEFNQYAFLCLIVAAALGVFAFFGLADIVNAIQFLLVVAGCMLYIYGMYYYVSIVMVGIDLQSFSDAFIICSALIGSAVVASTVNVLAK